LVLCLILSCSKDDEIEVPTTSINSVAGEFSIEQCGVQLQGSVFSPTPTTEFGFVYSYENQVPTIEDFKITFFGPSGTDSFTGLVTDYSSGARLNWRTYAIIGDEVLYSTIRIFSVAITNQNTFRELNDSRELFIVSFDCPSTEKLINVELNFPLCLLEEFKFELCMSTPSNFECEEISITDGSVLTIPLEFDVNTVEFVTTSLDQPDVRVFHGRTIVTTGEEINATAQSNMPLAVAESTGFRFGDSFYLCGGYTESELIFTSDFWKYNMVNDEWEQLEDFPGGPRAVMLSTVIDDIAYIGGGGPIFEASSEFYSYNLTTDTWTTLASLPAAGTGGVSFALKDNIYVTNLLAEQHRLEALYVYNIANNTWSTLNSLPFNGVSARNMAVAVNGIGYMINTFDQYVNIYQYDEVSDQWNLIRIDDISCNDGIVFGGENSLYITSGRGMDGVYKLDLESNQPSLFCTENRDLRSEAVGTLFNGKLFVFGGLEHDLDPTNFTKALNTVYSLDITN